jgi:hypothetical protein
MRRYNYKNHSEIPPYMADISRMLLELLKR